MSLTKKVRITKTPFDIFTLLTNLVKLFLLHFCACLKTEREQFPDLIIFILIVYVTFGYFNLNNFPNPIFTFY